VSAAVDGRGPYDIGNGVWLIVAKLDGGRVRLEVYRQEEELVPPFLISSVVVAVSEGGETSAPFSVPPP
jgi:hypothetical protein